MLRSLVLLAATPAVTFALGAHQHGHVSFEMAIDGMKSAVEIKGPAESFVGFEHKAKTKKEKQAVKDTEKLFKDKALELIGFASDLECKVSQQSVDWNFDVHEGHDHGHDHDHDKKEHKDHDKHKGEHAELKASYQFTCKKMIKATTLTLGLKKNFPKIQEIEVAVLPTSGNAFALELEGEKSDVTIP